jgi:hypothetical protein
MDLVGIFEDWRKKDKEGEQEAEAGVSMDDEE